MIERKLLKITMIQIRLAHSGRYSISEMGQMAVEGGCLWLVIDMPDADPGHWRDIAEELVPLCRDAGVMLSVANDVSAVRELSAHGVYLDLGSNPVKTRDDLGAEAIVGAQIASADSAITLAKADIDYLVIAPGTDTAIIADARRCGVEIPFVALTDARGLQDHYSDMLALGFSGFCVTDGIFDTPDPVATVASLIALTE